MKLFRIATLVACVAVCSCGGGGDAGNDTPGSGNRITQEALHKCPAQAMSPVDMAGLSCLVGRLDGTTALSIGDRGNAEPCSVMIDGVGSVTVTQGSVLHTHTLSTGQGTYSPWETRTGFSEYTGRAKGGEPADGLQFEHFVFGTNTGTVKADGTSVANAEWKDLQLLYVGPADGSESGRTIVTVGSAHGINTGVPRITCYARL